MSEPDPTPEAPTPRRYLAGCLLCVLIPPAAALVCGWACRLFRWAAGIP